MVRGVEGDNDCRTLVNSEGGRGEGDNDYRSLVNSEGCGGV